MRDRRLLHNWLPRACRCVALSHLRELAGQSAHSPATEHEIGPILDNLELDKLMISDLYHAWYAVVIEAFTFRNIEVVMEAASTVY
jgi:hypothetical protein